MQKIPQFQTALNQHFPGAITESNFVDRTKKVFSAFGFNENNSLACISVCRDELTSPFIQEVQLAWGNAFNFSSLAGMLLVGKTGFEAAHNHAPIDNNRERYVYITMPHIAISSLGEIGICNRRGLKEASIACGALTAFHEELVTNRLDLGLNMDDIEQSLLKRKLSAQIPSNTIPDLLKLTQLASDVILEDLEKMISLTVNIDRSDFAVATGIQIHGPNANYIAPGKLYCVVNGERKNVNLSLI